MAKISIIAAKDISPDGKQAIEECMAKLNSAGDEVHLHIDDLLGAANERKTIHDLKEAAMTMEHALNDIDQGYQFNDDFADEKRKAIRRSVEALSEASQRLITWIRD